MDQGRKLGHHGIARALQLLADADLTFRGLGFYLLRQYGKWVAIFGTGVLFGLSHGLLLALPILIAFGCVLAWIREQTDSVVPGMLLHGTFNLVALVAAVTVHR